MGIEEMMEDWAFEDAFYSVQQVAAASGGNGGGGGEGGGSPSGM